MQNGFTATCWQTTTDWSDLLQTGVASESFVDNIINMSLLCIKSIAGPPPVRYYPGLTWSDFSSDRLTVHMRLKLSQVKNFSRVFCQMKKLNVFGHNYLQNLIQTFSDIIIAKWKPRLLEWIWGGRSWPPTCGSSRWPTSLFHHHWDCFCYHCHQRLWYCHPQSQSS